MRAFQLVAQHRSFTRAAAALFIIPSGLSVLEPRAGGASRVSTLRADGPSCRADAPGNEFLGVARRSVEDFDSAVALLGRSSIEASRSLSIGAPPLIAANILPLAIKEFRANRPDPRVRVFDGNRLTIRQKVEPGDMGLGAFFGPRPRHAAYALVAFR